MVYDKIKKDVLSNIDMQREALKKYSEFILEVKTFIVDKDINIVDVSDEIGIIHPNGDLEIAIWIKKQKFFMIFNKDEWRLINADKQA